MEIFHITSTVINWESLISKCSLHIGRSPSRNLDAKGLNVGSLCSYLSILEEFNEKDSISQRPKEFTLHHISLSFLMILDEWMYNELLEKTYGSLKFIKCQDYNVRGHVAIIATGSLKDWKKCVIDVDIPEWCFKIWGILHNNGFSSIFNEYKINDNFTIEKR